MSFGASEPQRFPHPLPHPRDLTARTISRVRTRRVPLLPSTQPQVLQGTQDLCDGCLGSGQIPTSPISSTQRRGPGKPHGDFPPAPRCSHLTPKLVEDSLPQLSLDFFYIQPQSAPVLITQHQTSVQALHNPDPLPKPL